MPDLDMGVVSAERSQDPWPGRRPCDVGDLRINCKSAGRLGHRSYIPNLDLTVIGEGGELIGEEGVESDAIDGARVGDDGSDRVEFSTDIEQTEPLGTSARSKAARLIGPPIDCNGCLRGRDLEHRIR